MSSKSFGKASRLLTELTVSVIVCVSNIRAIWVLVPQNSSSVMQHGIESYPSHNNKIIPPEEEIAGSISPDQKAGSPTQRP